MNQLSRPVDLRPDVARRVGTIEFEPAAPGLRPPASLAGRLAGLKSILWKVYGQISSDRILLVAAGVTFYTLLAIFPAITALVSLYGLFADIGTIATHLNLLSDVVPAGGMSIISDQVTRLASQPTPNLSLKLVFGLAVSLWSANAGMKAMFDALNLAYERNEARGFIALNLQSLGFTLLAIVAALVMLVVVVAAPVMLAFTGLTTFQDQIYAALRWPVVFLAVLLAHGVLYRFGPSRAGGSRYFKTFGGLVATVLWLGVSVMFSWYVANFGNYDATYGTLGAVIGFMTWLWLSTAITLIGAEFNAAIEGRAAKPADAVVSSPGSPPA